ncbi:SLC13 family permease [uncultured Desulfosarcina sp.]|uniref:SLC13 family permease n=1 Tax=uncultured Desulfosarcina sp. TaxID=218289 RepID=UPI0029C636ED|nr:SLC13 family permease [uncultured Desulfosarcina sp.]
MRTLRWLIVVVCLAVPTVIVVNPFIANHPFDEAFALPLSFAQQLDTSGSHAPSRSPRFVSVQMKKKLKTLIAGETGSFELEARLNAPEGSFGNVPLWDRSVTTPLAIWIASPDNSGIAFIDRQHPDRPHQHILVKFALPADPDSQPLTAVVEYRVNPRTISGKHTFWMDIYAELTTPDGNKVQDMGNTRLPFEVDTHLRTKLLMLAVIAAAIFFFIVEWVRVDVVAMAMMVLLPELGLLNAKDTFKGLSSNAVVAIIGVMIISYGLNRAGLVNRMIQPLLKTVGTSSRRLTVIFSSLIAVISSVMQNTGAAVLFLPAIRLVASYRLKIPISRVLMPIGMAAILGGTLTMIGTSPLILLNDILPPGMPKFSFLELTPIGLALVVGGIAYLSTVGMRVLAGHSEHASGCRPNETGCDETGILGSYPLIKGPFEIAVPENFQPAFRPQSVRQIRRRFLVNIVASAKSDGTTDIAPIPESAIEPGHILCVYGPVKAVARFVRDFGLVLKAEPEIFKDNMFNPSLAGMVEGVVSPRSSLIGRTIREIRFRETFGLTPLAIHQSGKTYYRLLADRPLQAGDAVLVHGTWEQLHALEDLHHNLIIITPFEKEFHKPEKSGWALTCFLAALFLMILSSFYFQNRPYNPIPLSVCLMLGAVGMIMTRVVTINEAYRAVDWRTVFLLGGLIPLGMAMDQTGTAAWIARGIVLGLGSLMSPLLFLIVLATLSCGFTMVISNVGACTLLVPLGISIATQIGVDPRVAAIVVGLGVSNSFILPTHQVNALYMGPGAYRTRDYIKVGSLLAIIYISILVAMTYAFYM